MSNPDQRRADLLVDTWDGVTGKIKELFGSNSQVAGSRDVPVYAAANPEDGEVLLQQQGGVRGKAAELAMPYMLVTPTAVEPNSGSYNPHMMRRNGIVFKHAEDRSTLTAAKLTPVIMSYQITAVTDDVATMLRMIDRWNANELWGFMLKYPGYSAKIKVTADKSFGIPARTPNSGGSNQFRLVTTLRAETYSGYVWQLPSIHSVEMGIGIMPLTSDAMQVLNNESLPLTVVRTYDAESHEPTA